MTTTRTRTRWGALALATAGGLFLLYPAVRPWQDETTEAGALTAMSSDAWIASHLAAMIGFVLLPLGLLGLRGALGGTRAAPLALTAVVTTWVGAGLVLPYYGAETYGLAGIAGRAADGGSVDLLAAVDAVRFDPVAVTGFALGLLALAAGAVLAATAAWRSRLLPRASGILFALGFGLFLPQFYAPPAIRIGHGVLVAVGAGWLALAMWRSAAPAAGLPPAAAGTEAG